MGPIWGQEDPDGPHVGPMNFAILGSLDQLAISLPFQMHSLDRKKVYLLTFCQATVQLNDDSVLGCINVFGTRSLAVMNTIWGILGVHLSHQVVICHCKVEDTARFSRHHSTLMESEGSREYRIIVQQENCVIELKNVQRNISQLI